MVSVARIDAAALQEVEAFCESRVPVRLRGQVRLELRVRGDAITIVERRPPWRPDFGPEWTSSDIARLRFDPSTATWSLDWKDSSGRWHAYEIGRAHV